MLHTWPLFLRLHLFDFTQLVDKILKKGWIDAKEILLETTLPNTPLLNELAFVLHHMTMLKYISPKLRLKKILHLGIN